MTLKDKAQFYRQQCDVMDVTRHNKRYGRDSAEFEARWASQLYADTQARLDRSFRIERNSAFLVFVPRPREIMSTCTSGRHADHELCDPLEPYISRELHDRTYNNRVGMGCQAAIERVMNDIYEVTEGYTKPARIIKHDLSCFFPNAQLDYMERCFVNIIEKNRAEIDAQHGDGYADYLRWLAMVTINCRPAEHCEFRTPRWMWDEYITPEKSLIGKPPGIGAPIGRLPSQKGMGLYVNDEVRWFNDGCGIRTTCFMDDFVQVVPEWQHEYALSLIAPFDARLKAKGVKLNRKKFYDQPAQRGLEFLGSHIRNNRLHLNNATFNRAIERIRWFNRQGCKVALIDRFLSSINSYTGLLKQRTDHNSLMHLIGTVDASWWEFVHYDAKRQCLVANEGYTHKEILYRKYCLTHKNTKPNEKTRTARAA